MVKNKIIITPLLATIFPGITLKVSQELLHASQINAYKDLSDRMSKVVLNMKLVIPRSKHLIPSI